LGRRPRSAPRDLGHTGLAATEGRQSLTSLNANKCLHRHPKQVGLIHVSVGKLKRALVKGVVNRNSGSHFDSNLMPYCINLNIK
jgi:hypothetical protein